MSKQINVALIGNPNTGKTSVFNALTGLNQKVGNYPGITVEKKEGICKLSRGVKAHIFDLPGTYSLNASSLDENVVIELLLNKNNKDFPDVAVVVTDVEDLKRLQKKHDNISVVRKDACFHFKSDKGQTKENWQGQNYEVFPEQHFSFDEGFDLRATLSRSSYL